jgi:hypothetical protein
MSERDSSSKQSLAILTKDFISLVIAAGGAEIELALLEQRLSASKRRLYDVANVLAGVGLIERCGKSRVKWLGHVSVMGSYDLHQVLLDRDQELDTLTATTDAYLDDLLKSPAFHEHAWFSVEDISRLDPDVSMNLFAIKGPPSMTIEVIDSDDQSHHMICKADDGIIEMTPVQTVGKQTARPGIAMGLRKRSSPI